MRVVVVRHEWQVSCLPASSRLSLSALGMVKVSSQASHSHSTASFLASLRTAMHSLQRVGISRPLLSKKATSLAVSWTRPSHSSVAHASSSMNSCSVASLAAAESYCALAWVKQREKG